MWGDPTSDDAQNVRSYTQDSMGKYTLMGSGDVEIMKKIVGGFGNTAAGTAATIGSTAASALPAVLTILDYMEIMPNKTSQTLTLLKEVAKTVNEMHDQLNRQMALMQDVQRSIYNSQLSSFDTKVANLNTLNKIVSGFLATAAKQFKNEIPFPLSTEKLEQLQVKGNNQFKYENITQEDSDAVTKYAQDLVNKVKSVEETDVTYRGFTNSFNELETTYRYVMNQLTKENDYNPMALFDKLCSYTFNFDTSAYGTRYAQRLNIATAVAQALDNISLYYGCNPANPIFQNARDSYKKFLKLINDDPTNKNSDLVLDGKIGKFAVTKKPEPAWNQNKTAYFYTIGREVCSPTPLCIKTRPIKSIIEVTIIDIIGISMTDLQPTSGRIRHSLRAQGIITELPNSRKTSPTTK